MGPVLYQSVDAGRTWQAQPGPPVVALETWGNSVVRIARKDWDCPGPCTWNIETGTVGGTSWQTQLTRSSTGATAQLTRQGDDVYAAFFGNPASGIVQNSDLVASHDAGRTWTDLGDPCPTRTPSTLAGDIASAPGDALAVLCLPRGDGASNVVVSGDGGHTFGTARDAPDRLAGHVALTSTSDLVVVSDSGTVGQGDLDVGTFASHDGGAHWTRAAADTVELDATEPTHPYLGFQTAQVGRWLASPASLWTTRDGGDTWTRSTVSG